MTQWYFNDINKSPPCEVVYVHWADIETNGGPGWCDPEELEEWVLLPPVEFHSVGFLVYDARPNYIVIAETLGKDECSAMTKIPCSVIKTMIFMENNNANILRFRSDHGGNTGVDQSESKGHR